MITLVIDLFQVGINDKQVIKNLTIPELGTVLTELSTGYVLVYDTVIVGDCPSLDGCTLCISAVAKK